MSPETGLSARARNIEESMTLAIDARAKQLRAAGEPVIGFGAGEPDFPTPEHIVAAAQEACADPVMHNYSPTAGLPELREAIAMSNARDHGYQVDPSQVLVTNGGKHALFDVFETLIDPGDEVLLPAPFWVSYPEQVRMADGVPVIVPTTEDGGFLASVEDLEAATTPRTKALIFVSPSNPTGAVYSPEQVEAIGRWAAQRGLWVITDEIYGHLVYGNAQFVSMPAVVPEIAERCIIVNGVAKTYSMTGWRVGWIIGPTPLIRAATRVQSHMTSNVANVSQRAAVAALTGPQGCVEEFRSAFDRRRKLMVDKVRSLPGVTCAEPEGAFYVFPSFAGVLGHEVGGRVVNSTLDLVEALIESVRVAIVPGEPFGAPGYARLSYAMSDDEISEGLDRIAEAFAHLT